MDGAVFLGQYMRSIGMNSPAGASNQFDSSLNKFTVSPRDNLKTNPVSLRR